MLLGAISPYWLAEHNWSYIKYQTKNNLRLKFWQIKSTLHNLVKINLTSAIWLQVKSLTTLTLRYGLGSKNKIEWLKKRMNIDITDYKITN